MNASIGTHYALAGVMLIVALLLAFLVLAINRWLGPRARPPEQNPPPEHGGRTGHKTWIQFRVRYAVLAFRRLRYGNGLYVSLGGRIQAGRTRCLLRHVCLCRDSGLRNPLCLEGGRF